MAKKKVEEKINLDAILFKCRDILRKARNSGSFFEKRDMMLTLVFLRFIGEKFEDGVENLRQNLIKEGLDLDDEAIKAAFLDDPTFTDGTYNLPVDARWSTIIQTPAPKLNVALDTALHSIAASSKQLKGCFVEGTFTTRNLAPNDIKQVVDEVNKISHRVFGEEKDLIGRVYEYFLKEFAVNATKEEGEFYTPHDVVQLIATMIEPFDGTLYDPCCGSGGMFVQSTDLIREKRGDIRRINVYGQEKEAATYRLAKMNLALRGISHNLGEESDSTFTHDLFKGLYFDYIMANPPFNLKGWYDENLKNDSRWVDYQTPPESNANYAWILHILSHLKALKGVAGFLLANGALGDSDTLEIRKKLIQNDKVEAIIILPRELFITTDISVTLWILNQNKKGGAYHSRMLRSRAGEILFIDLRTWTENPVKNESKKKVLLSSEQIQKAADIYHTWQSEGTDGANYAVPELYRSVRKDEIEKQGWSLVPSKYIEFIDHDLEIDYAAEMSRIQKEMSEVLKQEMKSQKMLEDAFRGIGYGIEEFIDTKANMDGVSLSNYKIVSPNEIAFISDTSRRGDKISLAINSSKETYLVSSISTVFRTNSDHLIPQYLFLFFLRSEFNRYSRFHSWGSARETFDWDAMCDVQIPIPDIEIQKSIAEMYTVYNKRKKINEQLKAQIKNICPILIRGSLEDGGEPNGEPA